MAHLAATTRRPRDLDEHELRQLLKSSKRPSGTTIEDLRRDYEKVIIDGVPIIRPRKPRTMDDFWIVMGWYKHDNGERKLTHAEWDSRPKARSDAIRFLFLQVLRIDPKDATQDHFINNRLEGMLNEYYNGSPYKAVSSAFPELNIRPWEMLVTPAHYFENATNRINATRDLLEEKLRIKPRDITWDHFINNRLRALMTYYNNSPYAAVSEAYPELKIRPWEMKHTPNHTYESKDTRIEATRWLVERTVKDPRKLKRSHFKRHRLDGMLYHYYNSSPYQAVQEAYPELNIRPWEMNRVQPGFFNNSDNVIEAVWWIADRIGKAPVKITRDEMATRMKESGLGGLYDMYGKSHYRLLLAAGLITEDEEKEMRKTAAEIAQAKVATTKAERALRKAA
ncbi:MAG: hypothetical protein KGH69_04420 [Candidatus Micrarchaeota archaeon]|nr:hypothetical protein [Candidatus Micrarchaeota archaeon]